MATTEENLKIYNMVRIVPKPAQKEITGGRLKGMTDISPMWRIQMLTAMFGPVGFGWKTEIIRMYLEPAANGEVTAFVDINLYVKIDGEWSEGIFGTGGSMYTVNETKGLRTSDDAYKMAYTDALSVACKALGVGADVYWDRGSKYGTFEKNSDTKTAAQPTQPKTKPEETKAKESKAAEPKTEENKATELKTEAPKATEQPNVPSVGNDDLPNPKKEKKAAVTVAEDELNTLKGIVVPEDVKDFGGRTLGEIADENLENLRNVAALVSDKALRNNIVRIYNTMAAAKKTA